MATACGSASFIQAAPVLRARSHGIGERAPAQANARFRGRDPMVSIWRTGCLAPHRAGARSSPAGRGRATPRGGSSEAPPPLQLRGTGTPFSQTPTFWDLPATVASRQRREALFFHDGNDGCIADYATSAARAALTVARFRASDRLQIWTWFSLFAQIRRANPFALERFEPAAWGSMRSFRRFDRGHEA